eukprot:6209445-Pleurochrysis_carterae.AAC.2
MATDHDSPHKAHWKLIQKQANTVMIAQRLTQVRHPMHSVMVHPRYESSESLTGANVNAERPSSRAKKASLFQRYLKSASVAPAKKTPNAVLRQFAKSTGSKKGVLDLEKSNNVYFIRDELQKCLYQDQDGNVHGDLAQLMEKMNLYREAIM